MNLLSLDGVSKALGEGPLFEGVTLGLDEGDRVGFVGKNGSGKSTFLRLLDGSLEPDAGSLARKRALSVSRLEQRPSFRPGETLAEFLYGGESTAAAAARLRRSASDSGAGTGAGLAALDAALEAALGAGARGGEDLHPMERFERSYSSLCTELCLPSADTPLAECSGGMVKKAALARALAPAAELLLLDEPTNHLDIETIEWLERRLLQGPSAFVLVTHDRWFLDSVCSSIMEIDRGRIRKYAGDFAEYLERRIERVAALEKAESRRLTILKRELAWLMRGARARATKSERRKDLIRGMQESALEREKGMEGFSAIHRRLGKKVLELEGAAKEYDGKPVVLPFTRSFKAGERIGLVGPNGSGKTTFLDLVSGRAAASGGRVAKGENTHFAYFDQTAASVDTSASLVGYIRERAERIRMSDGNVLDAERLLERFSFPRSTHELPLSRLSGGELRRLQLVRLLAESPNFLLLDEPTNDLDIETIELLEDFLEDFPGCVLAVSHDRAFLDRVSDFILVFEAGLPIREFVGGYADYRAYRRTEEGRRRGDPRPTPRGPSGQSAAAAPSGEAGAPTPAGTPASAADGVRKKLSFAERREYEGILDEISALEAERDRLEGFFSGPAADPRALVDAQRRYTELAALIETRTGRWEELESRAGGR